MTVIINRSENKNVVLISLREYNSMKKHFICLARKRIEIG